MPVYPFLLTSYRHYKGGTYTLLYLAENSERREETVVVYVSHKRRKVLVRPADRFFDEVTWPDGVVRQRFIPIEDDGT